MSYNKNIENEKQNPVIIEETTISTAAVTTLADSINISKTVENEKCIDSEKHSSEDFQLPIRHTTYEITKNLVPVIGKSMFAISDESELASIATVRGNDDGSAITNVIKQDDHAAIPPVVSSKNQPSDHLCIKNLTTKSNEIRPTDAVKADVVGDGTQMSHFAKEPCAETTTTNKVTVLEITTSKPPIPPTPPSSPSSPTLAMSMQSGATHLTHTSSDTTLSVQSQMCPNQQQQKMRSYHDTKQTTMWSKDSVLGSSGSISIDKSAINVKTTVLSRHAGAITKTGACSVTVSPCSLRKGSDPISALPRRVSFPKSDNELVTGYLEPANPWGQACLVKSISEIAELYVMSCRKHKTKPLQTVLDHLKGVELNKQQRQPVLSLKTIKLAASDCEALEEIFKRVQYKFIDLSSCDLDEWATSALFEMIEYYEATHELDISSNSKGMTMRGWAGCMAMVKHSEELRVLIAQGNPISKQSADGLGLAISASNLHTLKLEHCGLRGALDGLCFKLRSNSILKELWLAHNDLDCKDAEAIGSLLKYNHYIELIDISNNNIRDMGLLYIVDALILQSSELERRSMLHRSAAIDDDDSLSSIDASQTTDLDSSDSFNASSKSSVDENAENSESEDKVPDSKQKVSNVDNSTDVFSTLKTTDKVTNAAVLVEVTVSQANNTILNGKPSVGAAVALTAASNVSSLDEMDGDDDTEDTVKSSNHKNGTFAPTGQSMLDKLLSMNSESSSEEGASNLSTDTIAACGSEDASITSDDIFDTSAATGTTSASNDTHKGNSNMKAANDLLARVAARVESVTDSKLGQAKEVEEMVLIDITPSETDPGIATLDNSSNGSSGEGTVSHSNNHSETISASSPSSNDENNGNNNTTSSTISDISGDEDVCRKYHDLGGPAAQDQDNQNQNILLGQQANAPNVTDIFEVTAGEGDCTIAEAPAAISNIVDDDRLQLEQTTTLLQQQLPASKAVDVNKNSKLADDYDDTHSTDSAFESASEGDISRHLPEEYSRLSSSFDGAPMDDIGKGVAIETGTIATESTEYLADAGVTPTSTPTPPSPLNIRQLGVPPLSALEEDIDANCRTITPNTGFTANTYASVVKASNEQEKAIVTMQITTNTVAASKAADIHENVLNELPSMPKVTIVSDSLVAKDKEAHGNRLIPTPPPPSTSPGGASQGMRRTESSVTFITPATRHRSQSSDSLCSDNSLDGSISSDLNFSTSSQLNEKLTKNDTLTRQQRQSDARTEPAVKTPSGLKALALWNNNLSKEAGYYIANLLAETNSLELLNIGKNCLSNDFVTRIKDSLMRNTTLTTLGLQSAHLSANGIETLASILTFGGNSTLQRLDIRDNKLEVESLTKIAEVLKSNTTITQIDIDDEPKRLSVGSEAHMDYTRVLENVRSMCSRNEKTQAQLQSDKSHTCGAANKRRSGYYMGSRKISLTCHTRPLFESTSVMTASASPAPSAVNTKLEAKRKTGARLRSPVPSPPTISPSSSPNRSRFQVFRVTEDSPVTSPLAQTPPSTASSTSSLATNSNGSTVSMPADMPYKSSLSALPAAASSSLPTSSSLPSMATVTSSTQSIKRFSSSQRSRFLVSKIYEDPRVPLSSRSLPPITPPIHLPPTPIAKHAPENAKLTIYSGAQAKPIEPAATTIAAVVPVVDTKAAGENSATATQQDKVSTAIKHGGESDKIVVQHTTLIVTPPTPAIAEDSGSNTSTNIPDFSQNISEKEVNSTKTIAEMPTLQAEISQPAAQTILQPSEPQQQQPLSPPNTNEVSTIDSQATAATVTTTTSTQNSNITSLSPSCSSSSSSSSTSPASLHSNSSSTTTSSPLSPIFSSSSSDSTDGIGGNVGAIGELSLRDELLNAATTRCPLAVFNDNDNDITLTKNSTTDLSSSSASPLTTEESQQRQRKVSWMANPGAVDKLRSLFFQRSSSPENKTQPSSAASTPPQTNPTAMLPSTLNTTVAINNATAFNVSDCTLSDASSQQLLQKFVHASQQLSKVFRQNLSFGNEATTTSTVATTTTNTNTGITGGASGNTNDVLSGGSDGSGVGNITLTTEQHDIALIPTEVKQEIKENISPEHTINEETLQSLQKLTGIEEAVRCVKEQQQQLQQQPPPLGAVALLEDVDAAGVIKKSTVLEDFNAKTTGNASLVSGLHAVEGANLALAPASVKKEEPVSNAPSNASAST
uniref:Protein phosphatase 1 regulatory subunit 37 n=1 Tax=Bactrocera dorsalis TaxID=27457 RepID=A0A034V9K0_BACDO